MSKILLLLIGIGIGLVIAMLFRRGRGDHRRDLTAPPPRLGTSAPAAPQGRPGLDDRSDAPPIDDAEILTLVRKGRKIEAIKRLRDQRNIGLREAKDAVEALERDLP